MTGLAIVLLLAAAVMHATWNLLAKSSKGGAVFVWLCAALASLIYGPICIGMILIQRPSFGIVEIGFMAGSAVLHSIYFILLQRGYRFGDLSLVYPLARGTGPMLSTTIAIIIFGERPGIVAIGGAILIAIGVFVLSLHPRALSAKYAGQAVGYGLLTGVMIASYTLWDKHAVSALLIPPLIQDYGSYLGRALLLSPYALRHKEQIQHEWCINKRAALGVAILSPLAYILVLTAMIFTPVSYVAPAREISILIGTIMGARLLSEGDTPRRLAAAAAMVLGVIALAVG